MRLQVWTTCDPERLSHASIPQLDSTWNATPYPKIHIPHTTKSCFRCHTSFGFNQKVENCHSGATGSLADICHSFINSTCTYTASPSKLVRYSLVPGTGTAQNLPSLQVQALSFYLCSIVRSSVRLQSTFVISACLYVFHVFPASKVFCFPSICGQRYDSATATEFPFFQNSFSALAMDCRRLGTLFYFSP